MENLVSKRFGRLTVVRLVISVKKKRGYRHYWLCQCDCGGENLAASESLRGKRVQSCGCLPSSGRGNLKHGKRHTSEYNIWSLMRRRCNDPRIANYHDYGGRGIRVCDRWQGEGGFENFYADMGARPDKNYSLERMDNDGPYAPENCKWATRTEQARNRRNNFIVSAFGRKGPLGNFVGDDPKAYSRVKERIKAGWDHERAIETPSRDYKCQQ